jgi:hypothetical protein
MLMAMAFLGGVLPTLFACKGWSIFFNGVQAIAGMVPLPFLLQWGIQFGIGVGVVMRHFPVFI